MRKHSLLLLSMAFVLSACAVQAPPPRAPAQPRTLTIMTHDSFSASEAVIAEFEKLITPKWSCSSREMPAPR